MSEINLPPFYIGQRLVYIDVLNGGFAPGVIPKLKKGDVVRCMKVYLDRGWKVSKKKEWFVEVDLDNINAYAAGDFVPIEQNFQSITLSEVLENETSLISSN